MLYIPEEKRHQLDTGIESIHDALVGMILDDEETNTEACIQYIILRLTMMVYGDKETTNDNSILSAIGVLEGAKLEYFRKAAATHNDQQEFDNGEINPLKRSPEVVGRITVTKEEVERDKDDE